MNILLWSHKTLYLSPSLAQVEATQYVKIKIAIKPPPRKDKKAGQTSRYI